MPTLTVDNIPVEVSNGATILDAAQKAGIRIPTLCYLEGVQAIGACRVCVVEVEGAKTLVASCVMPAADGMKVLTNSKRVRDARRTIVELLLSDHEGDCQTCDRNDDCELQSVARELGIRQVTYAGEKGKRPKDTSTPALVRDMAKCIACRRCVTVCGETQGVGGLFPQKRGFNTLIGPAFGANLNDIVCVQCGQCGAVCPVGAISERDQIDEAWAALDDPTKHVVVQTAPAIRAALGECFGYKPGTLVTGKMVTALRRLGFDAVFDTNFTADLTIIEEGTELLVRLKKALVDKEAVALPQFTSCSPGWIKYCEHFYPELLPNLSTAKSPQQMFGAVAKTYYAQKLGKRPEDIVVVSIMPCTAKKFEAQRPEMNDSGVRDVDIVLTTRELGRMIKQAGIDFTTLPDDKMDAPLGLSSGAADIFANTGGVMEAALRTVYEIVTGEPLPFKNLHVKPIVGLEGVKEAELTIPKAVPEWKFLEGVTVRVAVAHGLSNARKVIERIKSGEGQYHFVEVMTCPGGCIGGGGQPRLTTDAVRKARIAAIYKEDEGKKLRKSHENPEIKQIYEEFLVKPLGEKSHHLLHTHYEPRQKV
ncbi:MAG TPA: NADH-dependent [FeFe] hydrogenase, group A6 [Planctomycetota bacterium]|nr:NADH-dependent [FeFe] hydrogenase, group A6 [Planctomycetota bacterium]HRR78677.1 NADH-dependent [FeFe] hydrogenase, group A6 [Planctomycetota bacterium]HRT93345.1 NADH-dependent [FeFe] hydrogenase, group A6 [Planctomycetota bacterium]